MNQATITKLENKYNLKIWVKNKYSGYYSYELEVLDYNQDKLLNVLINNKTAIYKQIEKAITL